MVSLTRKISEINQPVGGILPLDLFNHTNNNDEFSRYIGSEVKTPHVGVKGLVVDYMVRLYLGFSKIDVFRVSLRGAQEVSDYGRASDLLDIIDDLGDISLQAAIELVGYDVVVRRGAEYYNPNRVVKMNKDDLDEIRIMIVRTLRYFLVTDQIILDAGITFAGGYTNEITSADADYVTQNTLWDLKTSRSKPTPKDTLQLLGYYLLGINAGNGLFGDIEYLGIYNPRLNESYVISILDIPLNIVLRAIRALFNIYIDKGDISAYGSDSISATVMNRPFGNRDEHLIDKSKAVFLTYFDPQPYDYSAPPKDWVKLKITNFNPDLLDDGIHKISKDDYWTYCRGKFEGFKQPQYPNTKQVHMLKRNGYLMFISENNNGSLHIMNGGSLKKLDNPISYYYDHLIEYVSTVKDIFGKFFEYLQQLSQELFIVGSMAGKTGVYDPAFGTTSYLGKIHGSIIDIDYYNHIYVNFYDGTVRLYSAENMSMRLVYPDIDSFLTAQRPDLLEAYTKYIDANPNSLLRLMNDNPKKYIAHDKDSDVSLSHLIKLNEDDTSDPIFDSSTDMYSISGVLKKIQRIFTDNHVVYWVDIVPIGTYIDYIREGQ